MLKKLGFTDKMSLKIKPSDYEGFSIARVIAEHKERYVVQTDTGSFKAEITGNMRYAAASRLDFPAVGDWVKVMMMDEQTAIIMEVFPRTSILKRQSVSAYGETQVIATNVDVAFIVQAVGHDFNLKRLERYLTICYAGDIQPIIIINKTDLAEPEMVKFLVNQVKERVKETEVITLTIKNPNTLKMLILAMQPYHTYCFLGSSGVGKTTLVNFLKGNNPQKINEISASTGKGKHTTTHRELTILENRSIVIDTPGMRELGITESSEGLEQTFDDIASYSADCHYADCSHTHEDGCAVLQAIEEGNLAQSVYENYLKLKREQLHCSTSLKEKRKHSKAQGKVFKAVKKERKRNKF